MHRNERRCSVANYSIVKGHLIQSHFTISYETRNFGDERDVLCVLNVTFMSTNPLFLTNMFLLCHNTTFVVGRYPWNTQRG